MQATKTLVFLVLLSTLGRMNSFAQTFENTEKAKSYFYGLDDKFNIAMSTKDSSFFNTIFSDGFINETPYGILLNLKK